MVALLGLNMLQCVDFKQPSLAVAAASIAFNPLFWTYVAQREYRTHFITRLFGGRKYVGCYALAVTIFLLGITRDVLYERALRDQPVHPAIEAWSLREPLATALFATGNVLVLSSMWVLGVTGTYLGDYFGILMESRVTGFPFNVTEHPMYWGSTMSFVATALWFAKPAGLILSLEVWLAYVIALAFEGPFTTVVYAMRAEERRTGKKA